MQVLTIIKNKSTNKLLRFSKKKNLKLIKSINFLSYPNSNNIIESINTKQIPYFKKTINLLINGLRKKYIKNLEQIKYRTFLINGKIKKAIILKRITSKSQGRVSPIKKPTSHITIEITVIKNKR